MRVLIDTNIILDVLLERKPWFEDSLAIWKIIHNGSITGYIAGNSIDNLDYILKNYGLTQKESYKILSELTNTFHITIINDEVIKNVFQKESNDIEDQIALQSALYMGIDIIITRNKKDFVSDNIGVYTPKEFLEL